MKADSLGSGPTAFGFNNPTTILPEIVVSLSVRSASEKLERMKQARDAMAPHVMAVTNDEKTAAELGVND